MESKKPQQILICTFIVTAQSVWAKENEEKPEKKSPCKTMKEM